LAFAKTKSQVIARQEGKSKGEATGGKAAKRNREEAEDEEGDESLAAKEARNE